MALDLARYYAEELDIAEQTKTLSPRHKEKWIVANDKFVYLLAQMKLQGNDIETILDQLGTARTPYNYKKIIVNLDGAARGNHDTSIENESGIAFVVYGDDEKVYEYSEYIGTRLETRIGNKDYSAMATSNVAEYYALIRALEYITEHNLIAPEVEFRSDSMCVVNQVNLRNATRASHLLPLRNYALRLLRQIPSYKLVHVRRGMNKEPDKLVNQVLNQNK